VVIEISKDKVQSQCIVGIDFGTTNSIVAMMDQGRVQILAEIPSVVSISREAEIFVGKKEGCVQIASIKRLLGKTFQDLEMVKNYFDQKLEIVCTNGKDLKIRVFENFFSPLEIATAILTHLKILSEHKIGRSIDAAVMTVPAYFDSNAKKGVIVAAKAAGINVLRVIAEPTSAAYAYGLEKNVLGLYLVFDLGGGTFDVSILKMHQGVFRVLAVGGDSLLGGDDIDSILLKHIQDQFTDLNDHFVLGEMVKTAKEGLSSAYSVLLEISGAQLQITRDTLERLSETILAKTIAITKNLVISEGAQLEGILLVGGSTKMPIFERSLKVAFPETKILQDLDPDKIVAMGAALQAYNLTHQSKDLLIDVNPLSLGIELMDGLVEVIIPRNSSIPTYATKRFTTYVDGQTAMQFNVVQGERDLAKDCISLAKFELKGIPSLRAGEAQIEVLFALDANGVLSVTSTEISTQISQEIVVSANYGVQEEEVHAVLLEAMEHFEEDFNQRLLLEIKNKSQELIRSLYKILSKEVMQQEHQNVYQDILALSKALKEDKIDAIQKAFEQLELSSLPLFASVLDASINYAVVGKIIKEKQ
jgi:molecular chaperone HscA